MINTHLSIWEIAHRWFDIGPDNSDPTNLPSNVQDAIRFICRAALEGKLNLYDMIVMRTVDANKDAGIDARIELFPLDTHPASLDECLDRKYDKESLDSLYVDGDDLFIYCTKLNNEFPPFWFDQIVEPYLSDKDQSAASPQNPIPSRPNQLDKIICQRIGIKLWGNNLNLTKKEVAVSPEIQDIGNGSEYQLETIEEWLAEVDPRDPSKKRGRKRKNNSGSEKLNNSESPEK